MTTIKKPGMIDINLEIADLASPASWQVGGPCEVSGSAKIIDLGSAAFVDGNLFVDINTVGGRGASIATDQCYRLILQGSRSATFASGIGELAVLRLHGPIGTATLGRGSGDDYDPSGRFVMPFRNERNGNYFRYLRLYAQANAAAATMDIAQAYLTTR